MDIWDWFRGLRTWWWMLVVFPLLAAGITWLLSPEPEYESRWTVNVVLDDPSLANRPGYFDFILLDDLDLLINTSLLGDVIYLRLPETVQSNLSRQEFGEMVHSSRRARFVEIWVSGNDPETVRVVADTLEANLEEVANHYLLPPTYVGGPATVSILDPITEPQLNSRPRLVAIASVTVATLLASIAATGVAEWLRMSYRAKYAAK